MTARRRRGCGVFVMAFVSTAAVVLLVVAAAGWATLYRPVQDVRPGIPVQLEIPRGVGTRRIAEILAVSGVVRNPNMFRLKARLDDADGKLRAGVYDLRTGMDYREVLERLRMDPPISYVSVTIPEGFTLKQIARRFEARAGISAGEFEAIASTYGKSSEKEYLAKALDGSVEGFLFPKTYRVREGTTAEEVVEMMLAQFERELAKVDLTWARKRGLSIRDLVVVASMVEREIRMDEERPMCASVIYNRLDRRMKLEIDATIEYILPGTRPRLLNRHLKIDSPYNTYMYAGLPVGPISNPGLSALQAAAQPAETDYLYYVLTSKEGSHTFTRSFSDFLKAKERSREVTR